MTPGTESSGRQGPVQRLQGKWVAIQGESRGKPVQGPDAQDFLHQFRLIFEGDSYTSVSPTTKTNGTFKVDPSTRPMRIRLLGEDGDEVAAVFEFREGQLYFCATAPGDPAPKDFKTSPDSSALFTVFKE